MAFQLFRELSFSQNTPQTCSKAELVLSINDIFFRNHWGMWFSRCLHCKFPVWGLFASTQLANSLNLCLIQPGITFCQGKSWSGPDLYEKKVKNVEAGVCLHQHPWVGCAHFPYPATSRNPQLSVFLYQHQDTVGKSLVCLRGCSQMH